MRVDNLTPAQKQALFCNSDWKLPEGFDMTVAKAQFEGEAIEKASLPVSPFQYSHPGTGTICVSFKEQDAEAKLALIRKRYALTPGADDMCNDAMGEDIFVVREGWTKAGDDLGWIRLNDDVILAMVCCEPNHFDYSIEWAVVARFDPLLDDRPLSASEEAILRGAIAAAKARAIGGKKGGRERLPDGEGSASTRWRQGKRKKGGL